LPLGPFVPVQTQLGGPRRVAAHFKEQRAEFSIVDVEVVIRGQISTLIDGCTPKTLGAAQF
jgi:hypothetical protein